MSTLAPCGTDSAYRRHRRNGEYVDTACRRARRLASQDRRTAERGQKQEARLRAAVSEVRAQAKPFQVPSCVRCGARLCDAAGEPRWEVVGVGTVVFVCLGGCGAVRR